jgi:hypothetical protein
MPEDSAAYFMMQSLHNWNCVDGERLASKQVVLSLNMMV